jgi:tRNA nucleotidyltransferase (CCA-adding enzyme)
VSHGESPDFPESLTVPPEVLAIVQRLEAAGFETWCVGGAVRDNLLEQTDIDPRDYDLATSATPDQIQKIFRRTVPVGVEHGTVAVLDRRNQQHEVTTFRRDVRTDGRHAVVEFGVSLDDDLARRDFTINAIAYHPLTNKWRDPHGGARDLRERVIRAVGDPATRFREDYLRILRALRFAARFGFTVDPETWAAAVAQAVGLQYLSAERVRHEWFHGLETAKNPNRLAAKWRDVGATDQWLPELVNEREERLDRFAQRDPVLMTAYLSRDPGATLTRLRSSKAEIARASAAGDRDHWPDAADLVAVRQWMAPRVKSVDDLLVLLRVDDSAAAAKLQSAVAEVRASGAPLTLGDLAVTGDDLRDAGIPPGREMGKILRRLLDEVLEVPSRNDRDSLLERARVLASDSEAR